MQPRQQYTTCNQDAKTLAKGVSTDFIRTDANLCSY